MPVIRIASLARSPTSVGFAAGADIGADAAEPEQIDRRLEDRGHDLGRRGDGLVEADGGSCLRGQRDRFLAREMIMPPAEISALS